MGGAAAWAGWAIAHPKFWLGGHSSCSPTNNWPVCSLILRKISRIGATRRQILRLKCTNSLSAGLRRRPRWGSAVPRPPNCVYEAYYEGDEGKGKERKGEEGRERKSKGERREKRWKEGFGPPNVQYV